MPDEPKMPETFETLAVRITALEESVAEAFVEQREYTETAFNLLGGEMKALQGEMKTLQGEVKTLRGEMVDVRGGFGRLERKLDNLVAGLTKRQI